MALCLTSADMTAVSGLERQGRLIGRCVSAPTDRARRQACVEIPPEDPIGNAATVSLARERRMHGEAGVHRSFECIKRFTTLTHLSKFSN